jgi:hypothetical protein
VGSAIVIGVGICFEDLLDAGWREAFESDDENVTMCCWLIFLIPWLPLLLLSHEHCVSGR